MEEILLDIDHHVLVARMTELGAMETVNGTLNVKAVIQREVISLTHQKNIIIYWTRKENSLEMTNDIITLVLKYPSQYARLTEIVGGNDLGVGIFIGGFWAGVGA